MSQSPLQFCALWANLSLIVVHDQLWARCLWAKLSLAHSCSHWLTLALSLAHSVTVTLAHPSSLWLSLAISRQGPRFSIRMIIWIFCSDTLWWLCVFLLVQQSYFQRVRRQCCLAISSSLWHSSAYKVLARLTKSLLLRPILCRPVARMICIQKTFGWYEFKEEMAIFLERQTDGKRANSFGLCLIALNLNSFFPFFMTKCTFFLLNSEMWNENHCFNKKVCNCLLNNFLNPSPQDIGLLFIPTQLLQHSLLNIMRRINQDLAQVGSMDQTIWLLRTLSW